MTHSAPGVHAAGFDVDKVKEVGLQAVAPGGGGGSGSGPVPEGLFAGLSQKCSTFLQGIWLSDFARCINIIGLVPMITMDPKQSILPSFISYANGLAEATCEPGALESIRNQINAKCNARDKKETPVLLLLHIIRNYRGLREMFTVKPKSAQNPEDRCLGLLLRGAEAKTGKPFTRAKAEEILAGDIQGLVKYILKDTRKACSICGTVVFDEGKKIAMRNGYTKKNLNAIENTIDKKCPARDKDKGKLNMGGHARELSTH